MDAMNYGAVCNDCQPVQWRMVYKLTRQLCALLFPAHCRLCGSATRSDLPLCGGCLADLPWLRSSCHRCAQALPVARQDVPCGHCQQRPPAFDTTTGLFLYRSPVDYLVKRLKFSGELDISRLFAQLLAGKVYDAGLRLPDRLVPVPLHVTRLRERGFNQAGELARHLGRTLEIEVDPRLCRRTRATRPQSLLPAASRRKNLRNAFSASSQLAGEHIAIVDDVMTSGHTCNELAQVLKSAGAGRVDVWVIARGGQR